MDTKKESSESDNAIDDLLRDDRETIDIFIQESFDEINRYAEHGSEQPSQNHEAQEIEDLEADGFLNNLTFSKSVSEGYSRNLVKTDHDI